jgi:hypothetical protein
MLVQVSFSERSANGAAMLYDIVDSRGIRRIIPLLDLVESLEERDRDKDGNGLLALADLDLQ